MAITIPWRLTNGRGIDDIKFVAQSGQRAIDWLSVMSYGARIMVWLTRHRIRGLTYWALMALFASEIGVRLPSSTRIFHPLGIVIGREARIGKRVTIMHRVTIGNRHGRTGGGMPVIEDDVFLGTGAVVIGPIRVGAGAVIGANAVITKDVPAHALVVGYNQVIRIEPLVDRS